MNINEILGLVKRPGRYIGGEKNAFNKPWEEAKMRICCIFPDLYEIGMSHQGLLILYDILNRKNRFLADRCYCPDTDLEKLLKENRIPLTGLETERPLSDFDILAITLPYELCYTNILTVLDLCGIPLWSRERMDGPWPLILGGGSCCLNPEPVADFFDAILIGDGEEAVPEIAEIVMESKEAKASRMELLDRLSKVSGLYIPCLYRPIYSGGRFKGMETGPGVTPRIKRRIVSDLVPGYEVKSPLVPNIRIIHDRLGVEIARGCTSGCRYCQASTIYRPVRERTMDQIMEMAKRGIKATGWEEISLLSLSTGDYSAIGELIPWIMDEFVPQNCSVSLPSLRVGTLTPKIMEQIKRVRKTGITLAPEAGSERLRMAINKGITEEALLETAKNAFERGWKNIKLYFMIGLPGETDQDLFELVELVKKVRSQAHLVKDLRGGVQVTASIGTFVPKAQTPFQWEKQIDSHESRRRLEIIKEGLRAKAFKVKWHDPRQSFLEGVFSRGDRRLSALIHKAWTMGARLDAWTDNLRVKTFKEASKAIGMDLSSYLCEIPEDAPLYWDHIDSGVRKSFLRLERKRSQRGLYTPDCRYNECQGCGVCDFKTIKNILKGKEEARTHEPSKEVEARVSEKGPFFYTVTYEKLFDARFIGHLDMVRIFHRAIRRAGIPVSYSKGFHPMPKISFENPIPLGMESMAERFTMELFERLDETEIKSMLQREMVLGIGIKKVSFSPKKVRLLPRTPQGYLVVLPVAEEGLKKAIEDFHGKKELLLILQRKGRETKVDLKRRIKEISLINQAETEISWTKRSRAQLSADETSTVRVVIDQSASPFIKPQEVLRALFHLDEKDLMICRYLKLWHS